jgi:hypothetical protein
MQPPRTALPSSDRGPRPAADLRVEVRTEESPRGAAVVELGPARYGRVPGFWDRPRPGIARSLLLEGASR